MKEKWVDGGWDVRGRGDDGDIYSMGEVCSGGERERGDRMNWREREMK